MKKILIAVLSMVALFGCSEGDEDCQKTVTIPQIYFINNQSYSFDILQDVTCDFDVPSDPIEITPPALDQFSYETVNFTFTPDTGNNTSRLQFQVTLNNGNNFDVKGIPAVTINADGLVSTLTFSSNDTSTCREIRANSSCTLTFDQESSLDLGIIN